MTIAVGQHRRPWQAICLWSEEIIERLQADGNPITPGAAGENVTVAGIEWHTMVAGTRLRLGIALAQISVPAESCAQIARWFTDGDFSRIHHRRGPVSRLYATVIEPGRVTVGDDVVVEPDS